MASTTFSGPVTSTAGLSPDPILLYLSLLT